MEGGAEGRTELAANPDPFTLSLSSSLSPKSSPSSSSSSSSSRNVPALLATRAQRHFHGDKDEIEDERSSGSFVDSVFGSVPTRIEVQHAIAAFQSFMMQGLQPMLRNHDSTILQSSGFQRVVDAFRLLQTMPSVQKMVASISCDRAVWNAVMKNTEVQKFQRSLKQAKVCRPQGSDEDTDMVSMILRWILDNMKLKIVELIEILKSLVKKSVESPGNKTTNCRSKHQDEFEEIICSTVLLSTITFMIVIVTRVQGR